MVQIRIFTFEEMMKQRNVKEIKVLQEKLTEKAKSFIESFGFTSEEEEYVKKNITMIIYAIQ